MQIKVTMTFDADPRMFPPEDPGIAKENASQLINEAYSHSIDKRSRWIEEDDPKIKAALKLDQSICEDTWKQMRDSLKVDCSTNG